MIDLSCAREVTNEFGGSELKKTIIYQGQRYMIKFPDPARSKKAVLRYLNNIYSEEIGCKIFAALGMRVQETFLGLYPIKGVLKPVVACRDFRPEGYRLIEAGTMGLSNVETGRKMTTDFADVEEFLSQLKASAEQRAAFRREFWDMFVVDTLLGNKDRHLGNWGFLVDREDNYTFAPIYDCGSALTPDKSEAQLAQIMADKGEFKNQEYNVQPVYTYHGKRYAYHELYKLKLEVLSAAVRRIVPQIDLSVIERILQATEGITTLRRAYLFAAMRLRYERILRPACEG